MSGGKAGASDFVERRFRIHRACAISLEPSGGVPPFGHELPVVFDAWLMRYDRIWAAGGDGNTLFEITPERLAECTQATIGPLGE